MNIITWILFGVGAGIVAHYSDSESARGGLLGAILLGSLGAMLGGILAYILFGFQLFTFDLPSFIVAIIASLLFLLIHRTAFTTHRE